MHAGISPRSNFEAAAAAAGRALVANPQNAVAYQSAAEVHRWRAEWRQQQAHSVGTDLLEGKRQIEIALEKNPTLAAAMVTEAALLVIQAESESDARTRTALALQAAGKLQQALEVNPLLERENAELEARITALLPESAL